jgi:uncharacterized protein YggE
MKSLFYGLVAALCLIPSHAWADFAVSGTGKVTAKPDFAVVQLAVITDDVTAQGASASNKKRVAMVLKSLEELEVADKDVQSAGYSVAPKYKVVKEEYVLNGYQAVHSLRVVVRDVAVVGKVLDLAGAANRITGIAWDVEDRSKVADKARRAAIADAKRKAVLYAEEAGVTLGQMKTLNEDAPIRRGDYGESRFRAYNAEESTPVAPGEVEVTVRINVTYGIK